MLEAFLEALPIAVGTVVATSPLIGVSLLLVARPTMRPYLTFLAGWILGGIATGCIAVSLSDLSAPGQEAPAQWVVWLRLFLGVVLIGLATQKLLSRSDPKAEDEMPAWMQRFETMSAGRTFILGAALVALNPKNAVLFASGALEIASVTYDPVAQVLAVAGFTAIASLGVAAPLFLSLLLGQRAEVALMTIKSLIARYSKVVMSALLFALGMLVLLGALKDL